MIYSSLNNFNDTAKYEFVGNDLIFKENVYAPNTPLGYKVKRYIYYILKHSDSTLTLISPNNFQLDFQRIELLNSDIVNFEYLELDYWNPWSDDKIIKIDSSGNYYEKIKYSPFGLKRFQKKHKITRTKLSKEEMAIFKERLADFYAIYLPIDRGCGIDQDKSDFVIKTNGQLIESKGCDLSQIHSQLLDYLLNLKPVKN